MRQQDEPDTVCIYSIVRSTAIGPLNPPRLHRQRKGRRRTARIMDHAELAEWFAVPEDELKSALDEAGWSYHEDAAGRLWAAAIQGDQSKVPE